MSPRAAVAKSLPRLLEDMAFAVDVREGLAAQPKKLPPKYFYDDEGSKLFEEITRVPEYYPTRTEIAILTQHAREIASLAPEGAALIEFGAGASTKARILLGTGRFNHYVPLDISKSFLETQAEMLRRDFPTLVVRAVAADFTKPFRLPAYLLPLPRVGFFPGSTIGNFEPHEATAFLRRAADALGPGALMIVGADLDKDPAVLHAAYNDAAGVTAAFNLNLLRHINRELDATFDLDTFVHRAIYNGGRRRVEMHLISRVAQKVRVGGSVFRFRAGESIHTESSHKFTPDTFRALARGAGWTPLACWTDRDKLFSVHALRSDARSVNSGMFSGFGG